MSNGKYMVLELWNGGRPPVIIKGFSDDPSSKSKNEPSPGGLTCRVWKGKAHDTAPAKFLKDSVVF